MLRCRRGGLEVCNIARKLGIARSTAHRLLTALCRKGIAEQNPETGTIAWGGTCSSWVSSPRPAASCAMSRCRP